MELAELTAYALQRYRIREQHKWAEFPGFSVLCHPVTGKWVALLIRQWDSDMGEELQRCDLRCGSLQKSIFHKSYLSGPVRMRGQEWTGINFTEETEPGTVYRLFDRAIALGNPQGFPIVLKSTAELSSEVYRETPIPFAKSDYRPEKQQIPEKIRQMRRMYEHGVETVGSRARNFYRQGMFMQDYSDDVPWEGEFFCFYPTYHDLSTTQLRGYFTWRAAVRRGEYRPIATSAAYLYLYELLNCIGAASPEESMQKLQAFETGYLDSGIGDERIRPNLRRWMLDFSIIHDLPPDIVRQYANQELLLQDRSLTILKHPADYSDEEVFAALNHLNGGKLERSAVLAADPARGKHLFSEVWRYASANVRLEGKKLFTLCFGRKVIRRWEPLYNAIYYRQDRPRDQVYQLNEVRCYRCQNGVWKSDFYDRKHFNKKLFQGFLHEADLLLRRYLKTGRNLLEKTADLWAVPWIEAVIEADAKAMEEAARPKVTINLSGLDRIRQDALSTQNSLLTAEEMDEETEEDGAERMPESPVEPDSFPPETYNAESPAADDGLPLDAVQRQILLELLQGGTASTLLQVNHLMPSLTADIINELCFDEIGDTVLFCDGDTLSLVEDYREELAQLLGGAEE